MSSDILSTSEMFKVKLDHTSSLFALWAFFVPLHPPLSGSFLPPLFYRCHRCRKLSVADTSSAFLSSQRFLPCILLHSEYGTCFEPRPPDRASQLSWGPTFFFRQLWRAWLSSSNPRNPMSAWTSTPSLREFRCFWPTCHSVRSWLALLYAERSDLTGEMEVALACWALLLLLSSFAALLACWSVLVVLLWLSTYFLVQTEQAALPTKFVPPTDHWYLNVSEAR